MKRDMELVRAVLFEIEAHEAAELPYVPELEGFSAAATMEHVRLLLEAGMIDAIDASTMGGLDYMQLRLTWQGHDFVTSVRDPDIWRKTKAGAKSVGTWSISLIAELAKGYARQKAAELGLPIS